MSDIKHDAIDSEGSNHHYGSTGASGNPETAGNGDSLEGMLLGAPTAVQNPMPHGSEKGVNE